MIRDAALPSARMVRDLSRPDFLRIAEVVRFETGIELPDSKLPLVQARLTRRLGALGFVDFTSYCDFVEAPDNDAERMEMFSVLTTNVTAFFRERHHFEALLSHKIPELSARLRAGKTVRIWSAGCSSGEEPYSLAMVFAAAIPGLGGHDFKILATDIDPAVLGTAIRGFYPDTALRGVPEQYRSCFEPGGETAPRAWRVRQDIRDLVVFRRLNLMDDWPFSRTFDVILCRNVVIYFGEATKAEIWVRFLDQLSNDGWLVTGHSERLCGPAAQQARLVHTTTYQKTGGRHDRPTKGKR